MTLNTFGSASSRRAVVPAVVTAVVALLPAAFATVESVPTIAGTQLVMLSSYNLMPRSMLLLGVFLVAGLGLAAIAAAILIKPKGIVRSYLPIATLTILWLSLMDLGMLLVARHILDSSTWLPLLSVPIWLIVWLIAGPPGRDTPLS